MKVTRIYGIICRMHSSTVIEKLVINCHVVIQEVKLVVPHLLYIHLWHPVVGEIQGNVTAKIREF